MSVGVAGGRPRPDETETLIRVWEAAVRSTHAFLTEAGIAFYREVVREALPKIDLHVRRDAQGQPVAFLATVDERIEMLFVHSAAQGNGLGRELVQWARQQKEAATAPPVPINFIYLSIIHLYYLTHRYPRLLAHPPPALTALSRRRRDGLVPLV